VKMPFHHVRAGLLYTDNFLTHSLSEISEEQLAHISTEELDGKGRELADMMERRKVDILCVQETRWKGSKARSIGAGFKLFYYGVDSKRNGVGVVLKEEFVRNVLEVKRVSDRVMSLKLEIEGVMLNVVSGYAPQVGCELEEKERFWSELDEVMESIPTGERVVIGADFNGHVGEGNRGDEEVMGKFGVKERNLEGQMVVDFAKRMDMAVVNTYFQKREEHRVTYKSGGRRTQVDYTLCRRGNMKEISDCKVVVGESVARQHRMVVCRMTLMKLRQALGGQVVLPDDWETTAEVIRETGRKVLCVSSGRRKEDKETWWWNEEVQDSIQRKRLAKKKWDMDRTEENRQEYKELQRRVKREVSKAKQKAYEELYTRLDTREGEKDLYRLARQRDRDGKDVQQVRVIKDRDGRVLTSEESVQRRWKEYFEELMNEENEREKRVEGVNSVEQEVDKIGKDEVRKALKRMKSGKAVGPDDIPVEVWKCLGEAAVEFLTSLFNRVLESERMPEEWRRSVLVPIFKNKGDVQSCRNYRGIKLMSHTMKLWERVVEARLRKVVEICEQQYGFMPRKSTTDAIFALRILMEKYRDGQRELHCVFVDLEKAYDRVPREELWYCMRKSGVAEKYVRVVQDMYERSRTVVRCAVGQTEEFKVEVGLHQGSALSPFLFAVVMDQLSEEVRQESPWTMMFADDIVIRSESREQVEENLERWRFALERRGMKVSHSKTEYMCVNEREGSGTVRLQGEEVKKVQEFKYLGSTVQSNGECGKEVKKRVQAGWNGWRKVWGVLCDRKISARIKGKVYRTVVRVAMLYGLETVSLRKRQESELEVAELKMLRFSLGVTRLDRIRNKYIRGTAHVGRLGDKVREARLRWFGHVQRRESEYIGRRMLDMELPGRRQRGRPKRRYMDGINEDMKLVGASVEDAEDRDRWREMIRYLNPIQHLWYVLDKQVRSMEAPPHNLQDIKDLLLTSWCQIPQHTFRDLVESMPRQLWSQSSFCFSLRAEIREAFQVLDRDGNGFISKQELGVAMRSLGYMPSEVELAIIMQRLDMDGDGQVDFDEFVTILGPKLLSSDTREGFLGSTIDSIFWQKGAWLLCLSVTVPKKAWIPVHVLCSEGGMVSVPVYPSEKGVSSVYVSPSKKDVAYVLISRRDEGMAFVSGTGGSVVDFSPLMPQARVQFPANDQAPATGYSASPKPGKMGGLRQGGHLFDMQQMSLEELKQVLFHAFRDHLTMKDIENIIVNEEESLKDSSGNCQTEFQGVHSKGKNRQTCVRKSLICAFAMAFIISVMLIAANQMLRKGMD
ncbi:hypothetical protein QTP70_028018, partial [Hemibagrus guttatus]